MKKDYASSRIPWRGINRLQKMLLSMTFLLTAFAASAQFPTPYCAVSFPDAVEPITLVNFAGINNVSSDVIDGSDEHEDFTLTFANVEAGATYPITIKANTGGDWTSKIVAFFDWNQDGDFLDAGETYILPDIVNSTGVDAIFSNANIQVPLTALAGSTRMRIVKNFSSVPSSCHSGSYGQSEDYSVTVVIPTCPSVSGLTATTTQATATLSWVENGAATNWDVEYGPAGFAPAGTATVSVTATNTTISGLNASTSYQFYVRAVCSLTESSAWVGPYSFTTPCVAATIPFFEGFEVGFVDGTDVDGCWSQEVVDADSWLANNTATTYNRSPRTGAWNAMLRYGNETSMFQGMDLVGGTQYLVKFYARQDINTAGTAVINASFGLSPNDAAMTDVLIVPTDVIAGNYQEFVAYYTPTTSAVYYLGIKAVINYSPYYVSIDDISVEVAPACAAPTAVVVSGITSTTADVSWTENGTASEWDIEYVVAGVSPTGTPTVAGVIVNPVPVNGLNASTTYDFYVRAICSLTESSTWSGPYSFTTLCAPISTLPWNENFDNMATVSGDLFPPCWVAETTFEWYTDNAATSTFNPGPLSPSNFLAADYGSDSKIWTPEFNLIAGQPYEFSFSWAGDETSAWEGSVFVNGSQSSTGATALGSFVTPAQTTTLTYTKESYCFTPTVSGVYSFGVSAYDDGTDFFSNNLNFDDFSLKQINSTPGIDGALSVCETSNAVDLNTVISNAPVGGNWSFNLNPNAVNNAGILNATNVPSGTHQFMYVTGGCAPDTTVATITIVRAASAGNDGAISVCRNQPFNLLSGLSGNADLGGVWTDPNASPVANGNATAANIPGQYNFKYIVSNGVCPADTAKVVVSVQGCNFLGLDEVAFEGFSMYPNPTSDIVYIANSGSTEVFNYEVLDMNGRIILKADQAINGTATTELNLSNVEIGVYMIRVFNENADKTFRVVKN